MTGQIRDPHSLVENVNEFEDVAQAPKHDHSSLVTDEPILEQSQLESEHSIKMNVVRTKLDLSTGTQRDPHSLVENVNEFEDVARQPKHVVSHEQD
ncbi:hypothetical protein PSN45_003940 [Yamadazyma tenuis]|uniref:uncharacterized protein n=1 Tax=Candida tenuis TaxID=2315449 RepID=UPI0027A8757B|nr:hypothetical protein PSN45_003940 [Yamadazyma tenuis]